MTADELLRELEEELLPKIYGFCFGKLSDPEEARDLAQDICLEIVAAIRRGQRIENLRAFTWAVSNHRFCAWLRRRRRNSTVWLSDAMAMVLPADEDVEEQVILRERSGVLARELALLTRQTREAAVLHYFDGLSCREIAGRLGRSEGTVKWMLHEARDELGKGMKSMREFGEKSYHPGRLTLSCQGMPGADGEPMRCAERRSAQNILLAAYDEPKTVEELCTELGIAAPYIEDEVDYLVANELLREVSREKFATDFVILASDAEGPDLYRLLFPAYYDVLSAFLGENRDALEGKPCNLSGFSWERLLWVYLHFFVQSATEQFKFGHGIAIPYAEFPDRPNGGKWLAHGFDNSAARQREAAETEVFDGPVHKSAESEVEGFFHAWSGTDSGPFFRLPDAVFDLGAALIEGRKDAEKLDGEDRYLLSLALENGLFEKMPDGIRPTYFHTNAEGGRILGGLAEAFYHRVEKMLAAGWNAILSAYGKSIPKRLRDQMGNKLANELNALVPCSLGEALRRGEIKPPEGETKRWISLWSVGA